MLRYSQEEKSRIFRNILENDSSLREEKSLYIYTKDILSNRLGHLKEIYPQNALHAVAIKSNNILGVLAEIIKQDCGLEAASLEEVKLAIEAGCPSDKIVFDSPVKTQTEIDFCDAHYDGLHLNANCFAELDRLKNTQNLNIGIRINPLVDTGSPGIFNVSNNRSKFGIPISKKEEIIKYAIETENVSGLHVHAGSEIGIIEGHIEAIGRVYDVAEELNQTQAGKIKFLDIGGGFPANMQEGEQKDLVGFVKLLQERCPNLFSNYKVITEYGRFVHAHAAFVATKVEYILDYTEPQIALVHVGADLFPREIYSSHPPHHQISLLDNDGNMKRGKGQAYDIGGPLCFSGDFLKRDAKLPLIEEQDYILIADCGANTISMWSGHCSREKVRTIII